MAEAKKQASRHAETFDGKLDRAPSIAGRISVDNGFGRVGAETINGRHRFGHDEQRRFFPPKAAFEARDLTLPMPGKIEIRRPLEHLFARVHLQDLRNAIGTPILADAGDPTNLAGLEKQAWRVGSGPAPRLPTL